MDSVTVVTFSDENQLVSVAAVHPDEASAINAVYAELNIASITGSVERDEDGCAIIKLEDGEPMEAFYRLETFHMGGVL